MCQLCCFTSPFAGIAEVLTAIKIERNYCNIYNLGMEAESRFSFDILLHIDS